MERKEKIISLEVHHFPLIGKFSWYILMVFVLFLRVSSQICNLDLGIILDESTSITRWGFEQEKNFVKSLTSQLQVSNTNTRISIMTFSTTPQMRVNFRDLAGQNLIALNFALYWMHHRGKQTISHCLHTNPPVTAYI